MREYGFLEKEIEEIKDKIKQTVSNAYEHAKTLPVQDIGEVLEIHKSVVNRMWGRQ
jgi:TPP-dependent pyruvate/acetoin dehydrogenase alpha subunit